MPFTLRKAKDYLRSIGKNEPPVDPLANIGQFGKLSGELRNQIYEEVVVLDKPIVFRRCSGSEDAQRQSIYPGLVGTCTLIRKETLSMFYAENTFAFRLPKPSMIGSEAKFNMIKDNVKSWLSLLHRSGSHASRIRCIGVACERFFGTRYDLACIVAEITEANGEVNATTSNALFGWCQCWEKVWEIGKATLSPPDRILKALACCMKELEEGVADSRSNDCARAKCGWPGTVSRGSVG